MIYLLYAILGFAPSFIWLLFYLRKDKHPEPNAMVIKVFIWGMLIGPIAIVLELFVKWLLEPMDLRNFFDSLSVQNWTFLFNIVVTAPVVEEFLKYKIVKEKVLKSPEFDEPLDAMLYLIIAALGFAAIENLILIFQQPFQPFRSVLSLAALRFLSATLVHALASGMLGYWLARSLREPQKKTKMLVKGFALAIFFHSSYNYLCWLLYSKINTAAFLAPLLMIAALIILMAIAVSFNFSVLKKFHSVCRICKIKS